MVQDVVRLALLESSSVSRGRGSGSHAEVRYRRPRAVSPQLSQLSGFYPGPPMVPPRRSTCKPSPEALISQCSELHTYKRCGLPEQHRQSTTNSDGVSRWGLGGIRGIRRWGDSSLPRRQNVTSLDETENRGHPTLDVIEPRSTDEPGKSSSSRHCARILDRVASLARPTLTLAPEKWCPWETRASIGVVSSSHLPLALP